MNTSNKKKFVKKTDAAKAKKAGKPAPARATRQAVKLQAKSSPARRKTISKRPLKQVGPKLSGRKTSAAAKNPQRKPATLSKKTDKASTGRLRVPPRFKPAYEKLASLRERLTSQVDFLAQDNLTRKHEDAELDFRSKEQGTDHFDRDFALSCLSRGQDAIFEIDAAINRIQLGVYGKCEGCAKPIEPMRLATLPYSRLCIACKTKTEAGMYVERAASALFSAQRKDETSLEDEETEE